MRCIGLEKLILHLSKEHSKLSILAHSQGNIVTPEALRILADQGKTGVINTYFASQAAVPVHCFDQRKVPPSEYLGKTPKNPNVYGYYYSGGGNDLEYFSGIKKTANRFVRFFNIDDYALAQYWGWLMNNELKPVAGVGYHYEDKDGNTKIYTEGVDRFYYKSLLGAERWLRFDWSTTSNPSDRYEIFSHVAQAWCNPLGMEGRNVKGFDVSVDLAVWKYDEIHYSHSRQFRSNIIDETPYWEKVLGFIK